MDTSLRRKKGWGMLGGLSLGKRGKSGCGGAGLASAGSQALSIFLEPRDNGIFMFIPVLEQWEQKPGRKQRKDLERSSRDGEGVGEEGVRQRL